MGERIETRRMQAVRVKVGAWPAHPPIIPQAARTFMATPIVRAPIFQQYGGYWLRLTPTWDTPKPTLRWIQEPRHDR